MRECGAFLNERTGTPWDTGAVLRLPARDAGHRANGWEPGYSGGAAASPVQPGWQRTLEWLAGRVLAA
jgi:hypothetical protein